MSTCNLSQKSPSSLAVVMTLPTVPSATFGDVGIPFVIRMTVTAMCALDKRVRRAIDVLRKSCRSVKMGRFHAPTMRAGNPTLTSQIGVVAKMIDCTPFWNRANPMFVRPTVSLFDAIGTTARPELPITKGADISLPLKATILKAFGFSKESDFGVGANCAFINSVSGSGCQPSTVMSPAPTSSNGGGFSATFYGANVHRTSIPNRLNIGG